MMIGRCFDIVIIILWQKHQKSLLHNLKTNPKKNLRLQLIKLTFLLNLVQGSTQTSTKEHGQPLQ